MMAHWKMSDQAKKPPVSDLIRYDYQAVVKNLRACPLPVCPSGTVVTEGVMRKSRTMACQYAAAISFAVILLLPVPSYAESCPEHQSQPADDIQVVESPRMQSDFNPTATALPTFEVWASLTALALLVGWRLYVRSTVASSCSKMLLVTPARSAEPYAGAPAEKLALESPLGRRRGSATRSHFCKVSRFGDRIRPRYSSRTGSRKVLSRTCSIAFSIRRDDRLGRTAFPWRAVHGALPALDRDSSPGFRMGG